MINLIPFVLAADQAPDGGSSSLPLGTVDIQSQVTAGNFFGFTCIANLISNVVSIALVIALIIFFVYLVMGGIEWSASGGDKAKVEGAQKRITNALIGLVIVASSYAIFTLVLTFFGVNLSKICTNDPVGVNSSSPAVNTAAPDTGIINGINYMTPR